MKKFALFILILATPILMKAEISFGPKLGYNASKLSYDYAKVSSDFKGGFQFGAFIRLGDKIFIQPELMYTQKGGVLNSSLYNNSTDVNINTIDIPVILGGKMFDLGIGNINGQIGPVASIITDKSWQSTFKELDNAKFEDIIWALQIGLGLDIFNFALDVRYEFGLNDIYKSGTGTTDYTIKNDRFSVTLAWKFLGM